MREKEFLPLVSRRLGIENINPMQTKMMRLASEAKDIILLSPTGSGKTLAFTLPVLKMLKPPTGRVQCIVIAPSRELVMQIAAIIREIACGFKTAALYGGHNVEDEVNTLSVTPDIIVATPGRLLDHIQMGYVDLSRVSFFILDEADRMLDMGFFDDIMQIVRRLPAERQTMLFSATMPPKIQQLASSILNDPAEIKIAVSRPADKISQSVAYCSEDSKPSLLRKLLTTPEAARTIVFASSKLKVKQLVRELRGSGFKIGEMHSDLDQDRREEVMLNFKNGKINILIATDIVARGIDIDDITMVVNYDVPHDSEDYVHRIGRTARAEAEGAAVTFVADRDRRHWSEIERFLGKKVNLNPLSTKRRTDNAPDKEPEKKQRPDRRRKPGGRKPANSKDADTPPETQAAPTRERTGENAPVTDNSRNRKRRFRRRKPADKENIGKQPEKSAQND